jgi:peptide/nickel transport system permease protein
MVTYIARRLGESLLVLFIMSFLIYALIGLMPGDPIDLMIQANPNLTAEDAQRLRALHGLDRPLSERYLAWLAGAVQGDFGFSRIHTRPVMEVLMPRLWNTVLLMGISFALALALALPLGMWAAARPRGVIDHAINFIAFAGISVPPFWLAILLIMLFAVTLGWLPAGGMGETGDLAARDPGPCASQRHDPGGDHPGAQLRHALFRSADHRDHVRLSGHGQDHLRRHPRQRLQPGAGGLALRHADDTHRQPLCRPGLWLAGPEDPPVMSGPRETTNLAAEATGALAPSRSLSAILWRRFLEHRLAVVSLGLLCLLAAVTLGAPLVEWLLGVDGEAVDLCGRVSLLTGIAAALCAAVIGSVIGLLAGYYGGALDGFLMRLTDGVIALPLLPLLIVLAALDLGKLGLPAGLAESQDISLYRIVALIALVGWTTVARLVRGATLAMREREFVKAAEALGAPARRIMWVHILPNVISPVIVATTLSIGNIILLESVLSFLGLGIQPPTPSWGNMLTGALELLWDAPHLVILPGLLIFVTVIAFNFLGDGLQDALDPRAKGEG